MEVECSIRSTTPRTQTQALARTQARTQARGPDPDAGRDPRPGVGSGPRTWDPGTGSPAGCPAGALNKPGLEKNISFRLTNAPIRESGGVPGRRRSQDIDPGTREPCGNARLMISVCL